MLGPVTFQTRSLKRKLWRVQREICRSVAYGPHTSVSIIGCHASGKTFTLSGLALWWLLHDQKAVVLTVAPTFRQVKLMWNEIGAAIKAARLYSPEGPPTTTSWRLSEHNYAMGFSAAKSVNAQGFHGAKVLIIADEAIGIDAGLWEAIEGIRAGGTVVLVKACNPTVATGAPYDDFTRSRATTTCISISAFDTPNLIGLDLPTLLALPDDQLDYCPFPSLTRRRWVKEMYFKWGPENPRFLSRVLGQFPSQRDHALLDLAWIERSRRPPTEAEVKRAKDTGSWVQVGLDVAGPGADETAAVARVNGIVIARAAWMDKDPRGKVVRWLGDLKARSPYRLGCIVVDVTGIGYNFALHVADQGLAPVYGFVAGGQAVDSERFQNAKAEQHWRLRSIYEEDYICHQEADQVDPSRVVWDEDEAAQLSGIDYFETPVGRTMIEPKDEAKARLGYSPDRAEAKVLAFARIVERERLIVVGGPQVISPI